MLGDVLLSGILLSVGVIIGLLVRKDPLVESPQKIRRLLENALSQKGYIAGSEHDGERLPEDKEVKIQ